MFDLADPASTRTKRKESPLPAAPAGETEKKAHPLDEDKAVDLWQRLLDAYTRELDRQELNREEQGEDEEFYDNNQWSDEDRRTLEDRGQAALTYNVIATTVNWVVGTEKRGRSDFHVLPRRKDGAEGAEKKTQLLKYLADCNRTQFKRSRGFKDAVVVGIGWLEDGWWGDDEDGEPIYSRYESWRNMLWDSAAIEMDLQDARYIYRVKWVDLDVAQALFPGRKGLLERSSRDGERFVSSTGEYGDDVMDATEIDMERTGSSSRLPNRFTRERVRIIEAWFKHPEKTKKVKGGTFSGEIFDQYSPGHTEEVNRGDSEVTEKPTMRVHVALFTTMGLLHLSPSPYRHNRYPFTPIWGNKRGKDGLPYGMVRGLKSINQDINKRASKALHILSSNKVLIEQNAVDDHDETAEELSQTNAYVVVKDGALTGKKIQTDVDRELFPAHIQLMERSIMMVQQVGGVTDENLGRRTNATSGIAIEKRQDQGSSATTHYFDNLRLALQIQGEKQLSLVEQFVSEEKQFRITNLRGRPEYVTVNDGLPENDIVRSKADYVISEGDWRASIRQAQADQLLETLMKLPPEVGLVILDLVVENMDLPNREEIVRRLRAATGQIDPDAEEDDEEAMAQKAAQAKQAQFQEALQQAELRKLVAEAVSKEMAALASRASSVAANIKAIGGTRGAIDTAADILTAPAIAPVADAILGEAGFQGAAAEAAMANASAQATAQAAEQQAAQEAAAKEQQQKQGNGAINGEA
jgi:hypothetical protein